uniref:Ubiquitin carboxyl-terminal hydrolase n=1 Tax=Ornithorhynchus anatinus TaxID=9258 RepID=F7FRR5_ORNAN
MVSTVPPPVPPVDLLRRPVGVLVTPPVPLSPQPPADILQRACGGQPPVPGVAGLQNLGNTCFINATLQCLSNTDLLAEYLALEWYQIPEPPPVEPADPDEGLPGNTQARGEVTDRLAHLVRALWTLEYTPQQSKDFKSVVTKNAIQFRGSYQHDAQEFLLWLLDRVHEDLSESGKPIRRPPPEPGELPVSSTLVQELFQAQYRSSLTCPHCQKQSNTFDPFLCISLPIPLPHTRPLYITVVSQGKWSHCKRIGVAVPLTGTVARLREAVSKGTNIPTDRIVLVEMYYNGFHRSFCDTDDLEMVQETDCIFAFEAPDLLRPEGLLTQRGLLLSSNPDNWENAADHHRMPSHLRMATGLGQLALASTRAATEKIILLVCNRVYNGQKGKRFGLPFVLHLEKTLAWDRLQKAILEKTQCYSRPTVSTQVWPFSLWVVSAVGIAYLLPHDEQPLCQPAIERVSRSCGHAGSAYVKLIVEWDRETKDYLFPNTEDEHVLDAESVYLQKKQHSQLQICTLSQCFQLYTREEQLAPDDAWRCPHCMKLQQGRITLSLWTVPDVLVVHLKRFQQVGDRLMKFQNMVKFPLTDLDMTPYVVKRGQSGRSLPPQWSPWRCPSRLGRDPEDFIYDLYAVCNHQGTLEWGHYTAYCKNSVDGLWYCFDDSHVQQLSEAEVCKQTAYILFYQRRAAIPSWSANSSVAGSTRSSLCQHWVSRLPGSKQASITSAAYYQGVSLPSVAESVEFTGERSKAVGGFSTRPFVRGFQRQSSSSRSSVTSPPAVNENHMKLSWSLPAKLQLCSNAPYRFSGESPAHTSSSTLEKICEASDNRLSGSCFGSSRSLSSDDVDPCGSQSWQEPKGRGPPAVTEGVFRDNLAGRKSE